MKYSKHLSIIPLDKKKSRVDKKQQVGIIVGIRY